MLYDIGLTLSTEYENAAAAGRHILRVLPAHRPDLQRRIAGSVEITPVPSERSGLVDFFGNEAIEVVFHHPHEEIVVRLDARVDRIGEPSLDFSPPLSALAEEIASQRSLDPAAPHHFLGASPRVGPTPEMTVYARDVTGAATTSFEAVRALGLALHRDMRFDPEATDVDTPPQEAFARRHGVCQDFTHVMIACLRGIGVPAGYVSGFLRTNPPPGRPRLEGADAMHAWARAWCGVQTGWVEFDPTNAVFASVDHVLVALGRDYDDVAPMRGVLRIAGAQKSEQKVDVVPVAP